MIWGGWGHVDITPVVVEDTPEPPIDLDAQAQAAREASTDAFNALYGDSALKLGLVDEISVSTKDLGFTPDPTGGGVSAQIELNNSYKADGPAYLFKVMVTNKERYTVNPAHGVRSAVLRPPPRPHDHDHHGNNCACDCDFNHHHRAI